MRFYFYLMLQLLLAHPSAATSKISKASPTIALVAPMSGHLKQTGVEIRQAVEFYLEKINGAGGINGQKVELLIYDDQGITEQAQKIAKEIASDTNASVIIGNFLIKNSSDLSKTYAKLELPIIAPTISEEKDQNNPWLFSTLFDNHAQGAFIASYLYKILKYPDASIIYSDDSYGNTLSKEFALPFNAMGGKIKKEWKINPNGNFEEDLINLTQDLISDKSPSSVIFLATQPAEAAQIVVALRRRGLDHKIFGAQSLTDHAFIKLLSEYPENQLKQGYFSDGIMATSSLILDIASREVQVFKDQYFTKFNMQPSWVEAAYYDAATLAISALKNLDPKKGSKEDKRKQVQNYLAGLNSEKNSIEGLNRKLYFTKSTDNVGDIMVGEFINQKFISAYTQLDLIEDPGSIDNIEEQVDSGDILTINSQYLYKTNIVFTGMDFIEISDFDLKTSSYVIDFYLWFRYREGLDATNIEFINQVEPIELDEPFKKRTQNGITYVAFRVKNRFLGSFDFSKYPFDSQNLTVQFKHKTATKEQIMYIRDDMGMRFESSARLMDYLKNSKALDSWTITDALFYKDTLEDSSGAVDLDLPSSENRYKYSRFNANISIERKSLKFAAKNLLPLLILLILIYLVSFTDFATRISVYVGAILAAVFEHVRASGALPGIGYTTALDYIFYSTYFLLVIEITITIIAKNKENKQKFATEKMILRINKIALPLVILSSAAGFSFYYHLFPNLSRTNKAIASTNLVDSHSVKDHIIRLSSWRNEDQQAIDKILKVFNDKHTNFSVRFEPIQDNRYHETIMNLLASNSSPDLFYLDGNEALSQEIIKEDFTTAFPDIKLNHELSQEEKNAWTENGVLQAVPIQAVAQGIFYNQDIFKKLNLKVPDTFEELLVVAQKIKKAGYIPIANGAKNSWANAELLFMSMAPNFIGGKAGRLLYSNGQRCFNDPHMVRLYEGIADLVKFMPENAKELSYFDGRQLFHDGKAAMWLSGSWDIYFLNRIKPNFNWSIFLLPAPKGQKTVPIFHFDAAIALSRQSGHKEGAGEFIKWLLTPEFEKLWQDELPGFYSLNKNAPMPKDPHARLFLQLVRNHETDVRWILPQGLPNSYDVMAETTALIIDKKITPKEAADYLQDELAIWYEPAQLCLENKGSP